MERRNPFAGRNPLFLAGAFAAIGIGGAELSAIPVLPALFLAAISLGFFLWRRSDAAVWALVVAAFIVLHALTLRAPVAHALAQRVGPQGRLLRATGSVVDEPRKREDSRYARFTLHLEEVRLNGVVYPCDADVIVSWPDEGPRYGDRVNLLGYAKNPAAARNPGQFDWAAHLQRRGIFTEIWLREAQDGVILAREGGNPLVELSHRFRRWTQEALKLDLENDPQIAAVIASMVLGTQDSSADDLAESFRQTGTFHLFAVSGFNVAILALLIQAVLQPLGLNRGRLSPVVVIPILIFYALVTGLGASSVRATLMAAVLLAAAWSDRPARIVNSLGASALFILAWDTQQLFFAGFQLSFAVVLSLLAFADPIFRLIRGLGAPDAYIPAKLLSRGRQWFERGRLHVLGLLAASLAASLGSTPLMLHHFHSVTPVGIVANIIAVPLATVILGLGILSLAGAAFSSGWAILVNNANWGCTKFLLVAMNGFAAIPGGYFHAALPEWGAPPVEVVVHDFERSYAVVVRAGGATWLLGCGHANDFERQTRACLFARGLDSVSGLVATSPSSAHLGAVEDFLETFRPALVVDSPLEARSPFRREMRETIAEDRMASRVVASGDQVPLGAGATLRILYPPPGLDRRRADDKGLVLQLRTAEGVRILIMSDNSGSAEQWLLAHGRQLRSDVLILGDPTKEVFGTAEFLRAVQPRAILRHERGRTYRRAADEDEGRPRFRAPADVPYLRTENEGAITLGLWSDRVEARGFVSKRVLVLPR